MLSDTGELTGSGHKGLSITGIATPGQIVEELLLQAVQVLPSIKVLMLVGHRDVQAVFRLKEVSVLMLRQLVFQLNACARARSHFS